MARFLLTGMIVSVVVFVSGSMAMAHTFSVDNDSLVALSKGVSPGDILNPGLTINVPYTNLGLTWNPVTKKGDDLDALSAGYDTFGNIIFFSVTRTSVGVPGGANVPTVSEVSVEAAAHQQAGDVYVTVDGHALPPVWHSPVGYNMLHINQSELGLFPRIYPVQNYTGTEVIDELDAISFEEFDLSGDKIADVNVYFSLSIVSPSLVGLASADDILEVPAGQTTFHVFADGVTKMGLHAGDDLDALVLQDYVNHGTLDNGVDRALFSLAPGSPTLVLGAFSAADIFYTDFNGNFQRVYTASDLGLLASDDVDALEIQGVIPEPGTMFLLGTGLVLGMGIWRRRRIR